jgi:hypothetical protein
MICALWIFRTAGRRLNPGDPQRSAAQDAVFRYRWTQWVVFTNTGLVLALSLFHWVITDLIRVRPAVMIAPVLVTVAAILVYAAVLTVRLGRSGRRLAIGNATTPTGAVNPDDPRHWRLGLFYYDPDDNALWVEKRFGIGYTINFGHRRAWYVLAAMALGPLALVGLILAILRNPLSAADRVAFREHAEPVMTNLMTAIQARDYERAVRDFSPGMMAGMGAAGLRGFVEGQLTPACGEYQSHCFDKTQAKGGFVVVEYLADFSREKGVRVRLVFSRGDPTYRLTGLWFDSANLRK